MVANVRNPEIRRAGRILLIQVIVVVILALGALFWGITAALSALLGGVIASIGNALFALWVFARYRAQNPGNLLMRFYGAELLKIVAILAMFAAVFYWVDELLPVVFMLTFFITQVIPPILAHGFSD